MNWSMVIPEKTAPVTGTVIESKEGALIAVGRRGLLMCFLVYRVLTFLRRSVSSRPGELLVRSSPDVESYLQLSYVRCTVLLIDTRADRESASVLWALSRVAPAAFPFGCCWSLVQLC